MKLTSLGPDDFSGYPPAAKRLALEQLPLLRRLPIPFVAVLLRELINYDWQFPAERADLEVQLHMLNAPWPPELGRIMAAFDAVPLSSELERLSVARDPAEYVEKLTAHLWTAHAMDSFRGTATNYMQQVDRFKGPANDKRTYWCAVVIGRGARGSKTRLFSKLRAHGTLFTNVQAAGALQVLLDAAQARATANPDRYARWLVDGAAAEIQGSEQPLTAVAYGNLAAVRAAILRKMHEQRTTPGVGPEQLRSTLASFAPGQLEALQGGSDPVLQRFQISLFTEGSGTQIFSTTFVQWTARELLRRARAQTLLIRYAPRQVDRPMNDLLLTHSSAPALDPEGSLIDADMGAYYTWINLSRIAQPSQITFLAWFEEGTEAVVIAPGIPAGSVSTQACTMSQVLTWIA